MGFEVDVTADCEGCGRTIHEGDLTYCDKCIEEVDDLKAEIERLKYPTLDTCRRCVQPRLLNDRGYCSSDCELGFTKIPYQGPAQ